MTALLRYVMAFEFYTSSTKWWIFATWAVKRKCDSSQGSSSWFNLRTVVCMTTSEAFEAFNTMRYVVCVCVCVCVCVWVHIFDLRRLPVDGHASRSSSAASPINNILILPSLFPIQRMLNQFDSRLHVRDSPLNSISHRSFRTFICSMILYELPSWFFWSFFQFILAGECFILFYFFYPPFWRTFDSKIDFKSQFDGGSSNVSLFTSKVDKSQSSLTFFIRLKPLKLVWV